MEKAKTNPIAQQSKQWLVDSLLSLMKEKPYQDITIKEISDKALLSRRTFYRNFNAKEEILYLHMSKICEEYISMLSKEPNLTLPSIARVYFETCRNNLDFLIILKNNNLLYLLLQKYDEFLPNIHKALRGHLNLFRDQEHLEYSLTFSTGGFWHLMIRWLSDGAKKTPEEMSQITQDCISNFYAETKI